MMKISCVIMNNWFEGDPSRLPNQVFINFNKLNGTSCGTHAPNMSLNIC